MSIKQRIKKFVMGSSTLRELYLNIRSRTLNHELEHRYGDMSRRSIFENIYSNSTWGGGGIN